MIPAIPVQRSAQGRVEIQNQVLAYVVPLLATPFTLHYRSDQVPGNAGPPAIVIPLAPRKPSKRLKQVVLEMECAGENIRKTFDASVRSYRHVVEELPAAAGPEPTIRIRVGQVLRASFPMPELTKWREHTLPLRPPDARAVGLGGWTLDAHHRLDPLARVVHFGNGTRRRFRPQELRTGKNGEITIDPGSDALLLVFDEHGHHLRSVDALTGAIDTEFSYGPSGELSSVADGAGNETRIDRRPERGTMTLIGPFGEGLELRFDGRGYLSELTTPSGRKTTFVHSDGGLLQSVVLPEGRRDAFAYDDRGRIVRVQEGERTSQLVARDEGNRKTVAMIDDNGGEMVIDREVAESGETTRTARCCGGSEIRSVIRPDGSEEISYPDGTRTLVEETAAIRISKSFLPSRKVSELRLMRSGNGKGSVETAEVNGRRYETIRDPAKRVVTATTPEGRKTVAEFDARGRLTRFSRWSGALIERRWDRNGKLVEITQQSADERRVWKLSHDEAGRLSEVRDPAGRLTKLEFDLDDRLVRLAAPDGEIAYAYADGGDAELVTRGGQRLPLVPQTVLDRPGVEVAWQRPGVVGEVRIGSSWRSFAYAPGSGLVARVRSSDGIDVDIRRDGTLVTALTYSGKVEGKVGREFDRDQQLVADDVNDGSRVEYRYDRDGLMVQAGRLTIERDLKTGDIIRKRIGGIEILHAWNGFGDLRELRYTSGDTELFALSQRHDALGRVVEKFERIAGAMRQRAYTYDAAGRLATIASGGKTISRFTYDANGNRIRAEHEGKTIDARYDARDQILEATGWRYGHTERGDRAFAENAGRTTRYEYDPFGPLRGVALADGRTVSWLFDAFGRPCQKLLDGRAVQTFLFDQHWRVLAEVDGNRVKSRFVYGTRSNVPEYIERDGKRLLLVCDGIGTPRLLVDTESGTIVQRIEIDELGMLSGETNADQPFGFAGGIYDPLSGLTRFGARHYDANTGRWTQPDPIGYAAGTNLYEYVAGDPINRIDPLGLSPETPGGTGGGTAGTGTGGTINFFGDGKPTFTPKNPLIPPEAGQRPVDNMNPKDPPFDLKDRIFNPKDPGPFPAGVPGKPNEPGKFDFKFKGVRCFVSGQNRTRYDQSDTGGLPRDSYSGLPSNQYGVTPGTVGGGFGIRF